MCSIKAFLYCITGWLTTCAAHPERKDDVSAQDSISVAPSSRSSRRSSWSSSFTSSVCIQEEAERAGFLAKFAALQEKHALEEKEDELNKQQELRKKKEALEL